MASVVKFEVADFQAKMREQGTSGPGNIAFICPMCGTAQSIRTLLSAGVSEEKVTKYIGFSCEGRWRGAGPARKPGRRGEGVRGCDWTLGGLFQFHEVEVQTPEGAIPSFRLASKEAASRLEADCDARGLPKTRTWAEIDELEEAYVRR